MNTELTFLMELFLEEEVTKSVKQKIIERIKEIEQKHVVTSNNGGIHRGANRNFEENGMDSTQAPSMRRLMAQNPDLIPKVEAPVTPAAAEALRARQQMVMQAVSGKEEKGRTSPRKF